jgi:hypothetical protein
MYRFAWLASRAKMRATLPNPNFHDWTAAHRARLIHIAMFAVHPEMIL